MKKTGEHLSLQRKILGILIFCVALLSIGIIILIFIAINKNNDNIIDSNPEIVNSELSQNVPENSTIDETNNTSEELNLLLQAKAANDDAVAWLKVGNTNINNVIMQTTDNEFYLRRDENKNESVWGCYYADYFSSIAIGEDLVQNTVIYGHTDLEEDPSAEKFSQLFKYKEIEFLQSNPYIYLTTEEETLIFEIFAVFYTDLSFYYIDPNPSSQGFDAFLNEVNDRNEFVFSNSHITENDKLLTLSGCSTLYDTNDYGNHRFAIMAKLVQTERDDIKIEINPSPKRPDAAI